jgi:hypothetical protein
MTEPQKACRGTFLEGFHGRLKNGDLERASTAPGSDSRCDVRNTQWRPPAASEHSHLVQLMRDINSRLSELTGSGGYRSFSLPDPSDGYTPPTPQIWT